MVLNSSMGLLFSLKKLGTPPVLSGANGSPKPEGFVRLGGPEIPFAFRQNAAGHGKSRLALMIGVPANVVWMSMCEDDRVNVLRGNSLGLQIVEEHASISQMPRLPWQVPARFLVLRNSVQNCRKRRYSHNRAQDPL